jgi:6-phosphofructokinase 2
MTQSPIVTLTLNPAIDISAEVNELMPSVKLRCQSACYEPGGGGVNVARVVRELGGQVTAFLATGGETGRWLAGMLLEAGIDVIAQEIAGLTRPSFHVRETSTDDLYRFMLPGPKLSARCAQDIEQALLGVIKELRGGYLVVSGSFPPGMPDHFLPQLARSCSNAGVRLVVDTSGPALVSLVGRGAYLIKPNGEELDELRAALGWPRASSLHTARGLIANGTAEVIVVTLGANGAVLITQDREFEVPALSVPAVSRVGAGDSFLAGVIYALAKGEALDRALQSGMSAGAAAVMTPGTALARRGDYERLLSQLQATASG